MQLLVIVSLFGKDFQVDLSAKALKDDSEPTAEHHPQGDVFSTTEMSDNRPVNELHADKRDTAIDDDEGAYRTRRIQTGFQRSQLKGGQ